MSIAFQLSTIKGKLEDKEEPSSAYKLELSEDYTFRELAQFYIYLKHMSRHIESLIDEDIRLHDNIFGNYDDEEK